VIKDFLLKKIGFFEYYNNNTIIIKLINFILRKQILKKHLIKIIDTKN